MTEQANILIVDDRPDKHVVYRAILGDLQQNLIHVASGDQALKNLLKRDFAVILLDVNMPGLDGLETAALIRRRKRSAHVPIIFITADYGDEERMRQAYALGAVDFIVSPIAPEILRSKVKVFVELFLLAQQARLQAEQQLALAEERAARAAVERANQRSAFMADASAALGRSLVMMAASRELPRLAIPFLADVSALTLRGDDGVEQHTEIAWNEDEPTPSLRTEQVGAVACGWWREAIERVIANGRSESFDVAAMAGEPNPIRPIETLEIPRGTPIGSLAILPLIARGRTLGAFSLGLGPSGRQFHPDDLALATDLADRAAMALDNALLYREVRDHDRRKNEFLAMLAHELRNPLAPITNALHIMDQPGVDADLQGWTRKVIGRQIQLLGRLVDDLLDVSRITQGKIELKIETVDVGDVVAAAIETSRPLIDARQHELTTQVAGTNLRVTADFARLTQILSNLLNNAAKYTEPRGSISLTAAQDNGDIVFRVRDSGMGIPPESRSAIFELFAQAERTLDRSQGGLGIGLTLVKRLVEMQGGSVSAHSEGADCGSEFTVRLPVAASAAQSDTVAGGGERSQRSDLRERRVLVVDDNRDAAESMALLLRMEGHDVQVAYDGQAAIDAVETMHPDAVLLDIGLPGLDGYEVAERVRAMPGGAGILLVSISGYGQDLRRDAATGTPFDHQFVKPIDPAAIAELLAAPHVENPPAENVVPFVPRERIAQ